MQNLTNIFIELVNLSVPASYMIGTIIIVRLLFKKVPKKYICILWIFVGIKLLFPFSIKTDFGIIPEKNIIETQTVTQSVDYSFDTVEEINDTSVNYYIGDNFKRSEQINNKKDLNDFIFNITFVWICGATLMICYFVYSWLKISVNVSEAVPFIRNNNKYYVTDKISSPFIFGIISPKVYIPRSSQDNMKDNNIDYILEHELAHKLRKDYLIKPIGFLLLTLYWMNPLMWVSYIMLCRDIELACDEKVIGKLGECKKKEYSSALLDCAINRRVITACPVAFGEVGVKERVKNILNYKKPTFWIIIVAIVLCVIIPVCFMTQKQENGDVVLAETVG